ncbi:MAG: metal-dependent hydrolase [Clostridia bacterium]|jgi:L-ascorbate metabolism protein UlaG (beta-lactamase superfamily)|nr:metal-dependent hydrolase [Clostridia bacterium]
MKIIFHGHSCFTIEAEGKSVLIDPFITGNPLAKVDAQELKPDVILLTHGHGDHLGDAISIAKRTGALVIAPNELAVYCQMQGVENVHPMHIGGAYQFDFGKVKLTQALHGSAVIDDKTIQYTGNPCGFLLTMEEKTIYHAGDTGLFGDMELIGRLNQIDAALLPIGDNFVMGIDDAVEAVKMLKPNIVVPMHYDTFEVIKQDPNKFKDKVEDLGFNCRVLQVGEDLII